MILSAKTDVGAVRDHNEDAFKCGVFSDGTTWAVICDGMGGAAAGEVASAMCVDVVSTALSKGYRTGATINSVKNLLTSAISTANSKVFDTAQKDRALKGMGTTVVAVVISKGLGVVAHVGDSRAYLINDSVTPLTKDHSLVQYMIDKGKITEEEAKTHPDRNIITRAIGIENFVDSDINIFDVTDNDRVLICTDGLCGSIENEALLDIINNNTADACDMLTSEAIKNGSRDNITSIVIDGKAGV